MFNSRQFFSISLSVVMAIAGVPLSHQQGTALETSQDNAEMSWEKVGQELAARRKKEPPLISRGGVCAISPPASRSEAVAIWSMQPLLIWKGNTAEIELLSENDELYWKRAIPRDASSTIHSVTYAGKTLQPGQQYTWRIYTTRSAYALAQETVTLQVLDTQTRDRIAAELQSLETSLRNKKASAEAIALHRANYFVSKQLLADAMQEMYSVKDPSIQLKAVLQELPGKICKREDERKS